MANNLGMPKGAKCIGWEHPAGNYKITSYRVNQKGLGEIKILCWVGMLGCVGQCDDWKRKTDFANGSSQSCGCLKKQLLSDRQTTHGDSLSASKYYRLYNAWKAMKERCKPGYQQSSDYFDKGIAVCSEWSGNYECFKAWALSNGWQPGLEIDRISNGKGYAPGNCRWVSCAQQRQNRDVVRLYEFNGHKKNLSQWAEDPLCKVNYPTLFARVRRYGWSIERALLTESRNSGRPRATRERLRSVYHSMISRCGSENTHAWKDYGGRGISVCLAWRESFESFIEWAMPIYREGLHLDRIDNSRGYSPENCRFVARLTNNRNRRNTVLVSAGGRTLSLGEWMSESDLGQGLDEQLIRNRLRNGWSHEDAIMIPKGCRRSKVEKQ